MSAQYFKVTDMDGLSYHGGYGKWTKGRWRSVRGKLVPCVRGLHLCRREDLLEWLGPVIWEAEYDGEIIEADNKVVVRRARVIRRLDAWNERTARLFAADCAERVLPIFEQAYPNDDRPRRAIEAARAFANGQITRRELAAARDAAWAAARDAARAAAGDAAWAAVGAAAEDAAEVAFNEWDAAEAAERAAARDAAEAAAGAAARAAARDAAGAALNEWATERLFFYLDGGAA